MDEKKQVLENKEKNLRVLENEVFQANKQLKEREFFIELLDEEWAAKKVTFEVSQKDFKPIKVSWSFEENPDYVEALKKINVIKFKKSEYDYNNQKEQLNGDITTLKEQIASSEKEILEVMKDVAALKDELGEN